ncbi:MAG: GIY-YIG nuclease family protein [bacterium]|nr:GIY-YIG nuclease family protein [bacterium]
MSDSFAANIIKSIKNAPREPGCYIFYGPKRSVLYVGKANNLRQRLKSYLKITDAKTQSLQEESSKLKYIVLTSEIEALIEESKLIQKLKPRYNVLWRDDKSYLYVAITRLTTATARQASSGQAHEKFPKIFITHRNLKPSKKHIRSQLIGPFTDGNALRLVMKLLRRFIPYCTCKQSHLRDCLNAQMGRCFGSCCQKDDSKIASDDLKKYQKNIRDIKAVLTGRSKKLLKILKDSREVAALGKIIEHKPYLATTKKRGDDIFSPKRVECYDNSNFAGKEAVGALTVLQHDGSTWVPDKSGYRKFKIKFTPQRDDPRMIGEVLSRRLKHAEWPYPDLIIIDGGLTQFRAARLALSQLPPTSRPRLISFAKPNKWVYGLKKNDEPTPLVELPLEFQRLIEKAIYYTHNFVIRYHRQVRQKRFIDQDATS